MRSLLAFVFVMGLALVQGQSLESASGPGSGVGVGPRLAGPWRGAGMMMGGGGGIMGGGGGWRRRFPYPPMLEPLLSEDAKQQLNALAADQTLSWEERRRQMNSILDEIPPSQLARLPMPPGFEKLPTNVYDQLKQIHLSPTMRWSERLQRGREILRTLPFDQRRAAFKDAWFPPAPPPAFQSVLAPTVFAQLMAVHQNAKLSVPEKKVQVDRIMRQVPADQLARLPLPPLMSGLPAETQKRVRAIMFDYSIPWDERHQKVHEFVKSLPPEQRRLMRPPLPPFVDRLPADIRARVLAIHNDDNLEPRERFQRFREIMESLPESVRAQLRQQQNGPSPVMMGGGWRQAQQQETPEQQQ